MEKVLNKAYKVIFEKEPESQKADWELAREILLNWNVPKMGEDLAKECIFEIIGHVQYPNQEKTTEIVGMAEDKAGELFPEIGEHDPHMDVIEWLEMKYRQTKKEGISEIKIR